MLTRPCSLELSCMLCSCYRLELRRQLERDGMHAALVLELALSALRLHRQGHQLHLRLAAPLPLDVERLRQGERAQRGGP